VSTLTLDQRRKLPEDAFAWPERRLFAVLDADDVAFAARLADTVPEPERAKVKKRVLELCARKGLTPPAAWKGEASMSADANPPSPVAVEFSAAPQGKEENGHIVREVPVIFRAGA
jgi:predicted nicotinamide N-methyase